MRTLLSVRTIVAMALVSLGLAACGSNSSGNGTGTGTGSGTGTGTGTGTGSGTGTGTGASVTPLAFNEILANPPYCGTPSSLPDCNNNLLWGDANGDGIYSAKEDEFIEIVNRSSATYDLSGVKILRALDGFPDPMDNNAVVFTFASGESLAAGQAAVVFSGVSDDDMSTGAVTTSFNGLPIQSYLAGSPSSAVLQLNDTTYLVLATASGQLLDKVAFTDDAGAHPDALPIDANNSRMSIVRVPDITGTDWALIGDVANHYPDGPFTPGVRTDGSAF